MTISEPCPFCENRCVGTVKEPGRNWHAYCFACGAFGPQSETEKGSIELWNQRSLEPTRKAVMRSEYVSAVENGNLRIVLWDGEQRRFEIQEQKLSPAAGSRIATQQTVIKGADSSMLNDLAFSFSDPRTAAVICAWAAIQLGRR